MEISVGEDPVAAVFCGDMGIKEIYAGDTPIYSRPGGYIYVELSTQEE